jgi:hypothetical protein
MNKATAESLPIGTVVMWDDDPADRGTVRRVSQDIGVQVDWESEGEGLMWISFPVMQFISIYTPETEDEEE